MYVETYFGRALFNEVSPERRNVWFDQCLGFDPLPADGGEEASKNLRTCRLHDYLIAVSQARPTVDFIEV